MAKQTFTTGQVLTAAQMTSLQQTAMGGGAATAKTASYVLTAADAGTVVQMNAAGSTTITVNTALFSAGDTVQIQNIGAGVCTITAGTATVTTAGSLALSQWEGGNLYFTSTSASIFFDIVQSSGMTNPMTTTGDMVYSSSGSTPARLGIGTTGQVVTVAGGVPTWATPAGNSAVGCALNNSADLSVSSGTITQLTFNSELFDTDSMHSTSSSTERITVPTAQGGYYLWTAKLTWDTNSTGTRQFIPYKNGTRQGGGGGPKGYDSLFDADGYTSMAVTFVIQLSAGDYVSMAAYQDSGGALTVRAEELFQSLIKLGS